MISFGAFSAAIADAEATSKPAETGQSNEAVPAQQKKEEAAPAHAKEGLGAKSVPPVSPPEKVSAHEHKHKHKKHESVEERTKKSQEAH